MIACPKCGKEMPEETEICTECESEMNERPIRAVPNIPRREPDPLPERPGSDTEKPSGKIIKTILLLIIVIAIIYLLIHLGK